MLILSIWNLLLRPKPSSIHRVSQKESILRSCAQDKENGGQMSAYVFFVHCQKYKMTPYISWFCILIHIISSLLRET